jgi:hypothetical protein
VRAAIDDNDSSVVVDLAARVISVEREDGIDFINDADSILLSLSLYIALLNNFVECKPVGVDDEMVGDGTNIKLTKMINNKINDTDDIPKITRIG